MYIESKTERENRRIAFCCFTYHGDSFYPLRDDNADSFGASSAVFHGSLPADTRHGLFHAGSRYGYDADRRKGWRSACQK